MKAEKPIIDCRNSAEWDKQLFERRSKLNFNNILSIKLNKYSPFSSQKAFNSTTDVSFYITAASERRFLPLRGEVLNFLASRSCKKKLRGQRPVRVVKTRKTAGKPDTGWHVLERIVTSVLEKSSGSLNCFSFLTGPSIKAKSTNCKSAILIYLSAFFIRLAS